jgi:hypothetical protein
MPNKAGDEEEKKPDVGMDDAANRRLLERYKQETRVAAAWKEKYGRSVDFIFPESAAKAQRLKALNQIVTHAGRQQFESGAAERIATLEAMRVAMAQCVADLDE